jgi:DNA-binding CsgD family transcriptional regulator
MAPLRERAAGVVRELRDGGVLSPRETEIALLVGQGLTNRQIAATAHISERTVETHVQHVLAKLGFTGRTQIAAWVARRDQ